MSRVLLVRHGQTAGFPVGSYTELTEAGRAQADAAGARLSGSSPAAFVVGPRERQAETAARIAAVAGWTAAARWPELDEHMGREVFLHALRRMHVDDPAVAPFFDAADGDADPTRSLWRAFRRVLVAWADGRFEAPEVEPWSAVQARARASVLRLAEQCGDGVGVAVTSAGFIGAAVGAAVGAAPGTAMELSFAVFNASVTELRVRRGRIHLWQFNGAEHVAGALQTSV
jgi:broad specificity phosphatase PhoE